MALKPFRRPNRGTPSAWESILLEKSRLSLPSLEFGIPFELASGDESVVEGGENMMSVVYSLAALNLDLDRLDPQRPVDSYVLPQLPLEDARSLLAAHDGDAPIHVVNLPRLQAKRSAYDKLLRARKELLDLSDPVHHFLIQLATSRTRLVRILEAEEDEQGDAETGMMHLADADAEAVLARWEADLARSRDAADAARRRVVLAVHHAAGFRPAEDGLVHVGEGVHDTILRLMPEVHDDVYGGPLRMDPCSGSKMPDEDNSFWEQCNRRTEVAETQLMSKIGKELSRSPTRLRDFSLVNSRRELIEAEATVSRHELRVRALQELNIAISAIRPLQSLDDDAFKVHLSRPTLLGNQVGHKDEALPMDSPFYPECKLQSMRELQETATNQTSAHWS